MRCHRLACLLLLVAAQARGEDLSPGEAAPATEPATELMVVGDGSSYRIYSKSGRARIDDADFYLRVGRPDLATRYQRRQQWRKTAIVAGLGGLVVGAGVVGADHLVMWAATEYIACPAWAPEIGTTCPSHTAMTYVGIGIGVAGVTAALIGLAIDPRPVDAAGARRLLQVGPMIGPRGAGLVLRGTL
jgi:hypothetical protein